jgi:glycosyltransferase involved in cell wall biosynthesis
MISFIMMAYNVEDYICEAVKELQKENKVKWELIIVEDFSEDNTFNVVQKFIANDNRIMLVKNIAKGKVIGTNYGYTLTSGDIVKCIDSDDILLYDFFKEYENMKDYDAHCHGAFVVDSKLNIMSTYYINNILLNTTYKEVVNNFISLPKCFWSFKREIADKIFPMPENLPFEDVWMAILIKKYSKSILNINKPLYLYRQHGAQTFGGILNYNIDKVIFRANRLIKLIDIIENEQNYLIEGIENPFKDMKIYLELQSNKASIIKILNSEIYLVKKLKLILILYFPSLATFITKLKWQLGKK